MTAKRWTYEEITCSFEAQIEQQMQKSHAARDTLDAQHLRTQAVGMFLAWLRLVGPERKLDDDKRLAALIGMPE